MNIDLKAIRAAAEAASPGPWEAAGPSFGEPLPKYLTCVGRINEEGLFEDVCVSPFEEEDVCSADINYIATANPATIIALLDRLESAEKCRLPDDWYPQSKDWRESPAERGEWLRTMYEQAKRDLEAAEAALQSARNAALDEAAAACQSWGNPSSATYLGTACRAAASRITGMKS